MDTAGATPHSSGEELFPSRQRRLCPATEELRQEADRRRTLVARRVMSEVARLPYYAGKARTAREEGAALEFWLSLVEFGHRGTPAAAVDPPPFDLSRLPGPVAIRHAVSRVSEALQPLDKRSEMSLRETQVTRIRAAAWVVLNQWRIEAARLWYLHALGQPVDMAALERATALPRQDWIAEAGQELRRSSSFRPVE